VFFLSAGLRTCGPGYNSSKHYPAESKNGRGGGGMRAMLDHLALNVRDVDVMLHFYGEVLGLEVERLEAFRRGEVGFPSIRVSDDCIIDFFPPALWMRDFELEEGTRRSRLNHLCLALEPKDWEACVARARAAGAPSPIGPVRRWGAHGTGISQYVLDPEGNMVELKHYSEEGPMTEADVEGRLS